jgi:beta-lactam-binding protein with PASTA domain
MRSKTLGSVKASLGPTLPCEAIRDYRAVRVLLAIFFLVASAFPLAAQQRETQMYVPKPVVPSITGQSPEDAQATLKQSELRGKPMGTERSTDYKPGMVSSQDPSAGARIPPDGFVKYRLAAPFVPEPGVPAPPKKTVPFSESLVRVPPVVGRELKRGLDAISKAGLVPPRPQSVGKERSNRRSGEITRQDPPAKA